MSKIFDALKRAELLRAKRKEFNSEGLTAADYLDRRGTNRVSVQIPLFVYGYTPAGDPFYEATYSISINGSGGLISMVNSVLPGQKLAVTNQGNDQTQECVVVSVRTKLADASHIALTFPTPMPQFWRELEIGEDSARSD
jgi:hypothetical protein